MQDEIQQEAGPEANGEAQSSIFDDWRSLRQERISEDVRLLALDVPAYIDAQGRPRLAVLYRYPAEGYQPVSRAVAREVAKRTPNAEIEAACDLLIACCASIAGRDTSGNLIDAISGARLAENEMPEHVRRFDRTFAGEVGIDIPDEVKGVGRHVVRNLFSPRGMVRGVYDGDLAVISASNIVFGWLNGRRLEIDEDVSGE